MRHIVFTVTNDLNFDQRMHRICNSLQDAGFNVTLVGVDKNKILNPQKFQQKLIPCFFKKGFMFYAEYNIRLFFFLLFFKADIFCCIDLDTIMPIYFSGKCRNKTLVYDAHEYFSEQKEIITRKMRYEVWKMIESAFVPKFKYGYTVSDSISQAFKMQYQVNYETIKNCTILRESKEPTTSPHHQADMYLIYQGAVNEARGLEFLIPAMRQISAVLHIYGEGNILDDMRKLIHEYNLENKVVLKGTLLPEKLSEITSHYYLGINLVENNGLNQYYSLANKFFDYIHAEIPQITMNFPEYKQINDSIEIAILIDRIDTMTIADAINDLLHNNSKYALLKANCKLAKEAYQWKWEENKLIKFYSNIIE